MKRTNAGNFEAARDICVCVSWTINQPWRRSYGGSYCSSLSSFNLLKLSLLSLGSKE